MKNKLYAVTLSILCIICLQSHVSVNALELPFVPVEEPQAETTVTQNTITTEKNEPSAEAQTENVNSEPDTDNLPVLSPDGDKIEITDPDGSDLFEAAEDEVIQTAISETDPDEASENEVITETEENTDLSVSPALSETKYKNESDKKSNKGLIAALICGAIVITVAVTITIFMKKKGKK